MKKLSLVQANFSDSSFRDFCEFVKLNRSLIEIDISYNDLRMKTIYHFIEAISKDRKLLNVNLSWNRIMDPEPSLFASILDPQVA